MLMPIEERESQSMQTQFEKSFPMYIKYGRKRKLEGMLKSQLTVLPPRAHLNSHPLPKINATLKKPLGLTIEFHR